MSNIARNKGNIGAGGIDNKDLKNIDNIANAENTGNIVSKNKDNQDDKYEAIREKYRVFEQELNDVISNDSGNYQKINDITKKSASIKKIYDHIMLYDRKIHEKQDILDMMNDSALKDDCKIMLVEVNAEIKKLEEEIDKLLLAQDKDVNKNVFIEIRAGVGGSEASLFVNDILTMYMRYIESMGWKYEISSMVNKQGGGIKEVIMFVTGDEVYSHLKYESGGHRVQRVPTTESSGRVHTSLITVAVLPEVDDIEINLDVSDLRITTCRASGAGGQHVNTTDSAVSILHIPTGIVVEQSNERSQHQNKAKAMKLLRAKLYDRSLKEQQDQIAADRKEQVGSGDRSDKVRTYNFPQSRVTDHRINLTLYKLNAILKEGKIHDFITELKKNEVSKR